MEAVLWGIGIFMVAFFTGWLLPRGRGYTIDQASIVRWLLRMEKREAEETIAHISRILGTSWVTPDIVLTWVQRMDPFQKDKILYHLVKSAYNGRRTIHRCPSKKRREDPEITFEK